MHPKHEAARRVRMKKEKQSQDFDGYRPTAM